MREREKIQVYLDANGGIPVSKIAEKALLLGGKQTNPSNNLTKHGRAAEALYQKSIKGIKKLLIMDKGDLDKWIYISTSGASEGNATAIHNLLNNELSEGSLLVMGDEHPGVRKCLESWKCKFKSVKYEVEDVKRSLESGKNWDGLFITHALSLDGTLVNVEKLSRIYRKRFRFGTVILDATQTVGKGRFDFGNMGVDMVIFSAHKFGGPKGYGGMLVRKKSFIFRNWSPLIPGSQQDGMRGGTLNVMGAYATWQALNEKLKSIEDDMRVSIKTVLNLKGEFIKKNFAGVRILGERVNTKLLDGNLGTTLLISVPLCSKVYAREMSKEGFDIGIGSACQTGEERFLGLKDGDKIGVFWGFEDRTDPSIWRYKLRISLEPGKTFDVKQFIDLFEKIHIGLIKENIRALEQMLL